MVDSCPFCEPAADRIFYENDQVRALWDGFPVSKGHALVITRRHVPTWFDATPEEQSQLFRAIADVKYQIEARHAPQGYNIGFNTGKAAGQTIFHVHIHVIPRYDGDVPDPRGGIRHVIASKANYLALQSANAEILGGPPHLKELVRGGDEDPLLKHLVAHLDSAEAVDIAVAFSMDTGVRLISDHLRDVLKRGGRVRLVTGDYMGVTQPEALLKLIDLGADDKERRICLRVFESNGTSFHPKAYIVRDRSGRRTAFVGSSNLSRAALNGGVEWNYRVISSSEPSSIDVIEQAFEELFNDPRTKPITVEWVKSYERRRAPLLPVMTGVDEPPLEVPRPHEIQQQALKALDECRANGASASLVVLATGLGKTWLSAFDSARPTYRRVLFVAHREEILGQAMRNFRAVRPGATLGFYTGTQKDSTADVVFASIQTIGRQYHLSRFAPKEFDYVIVDEFHHASASTYRRLIGYLEPQFLLGLTATPERTDGGDLLSLCGDNVAFRRDVGDGIRAGLLCPYSYFGVPDEVDYENIPWRSGRFDEEALTQHVATIGRAQNALEQLRLRGGERTIAFCVSQRHADFMAQHFRDQGVRAVAVHAGPSSAPRAHALEQLQHGELQVLFAVDMFNEGVDVPEIDSVLMLRPTESRIVWLQQFGRGLRYKPGKVLKVIDYIGNHRSFLTKTRALLNLGDSNRDLSYALDRYERSQLDLPPGCSVTYELEAINILRGLIQPLPGTGQLEVFYRDFRERTGWRPSALEVVQEGYNPSSARQQYGSWFEFVRAMGDLRPEQERALASAAEFLRKLEVTPMTKSYKMLVLLSMLDEEAFPGSISIERLVERFLDNARRYSMVRTEIGSAMEDGEAIRRLLEQNPIAAWVGGQGMEGVGYFTYESGILRTSPQLNIAAEHQDAAHDLVREVAEWRLHAYLRRATLNKSADRIVCRVSQSSGRPMLFLPDRNKQAGIPEGWQDVEIEGQGHQANFVRVAVNVIAKPGSERNVLPEILKAWFGEAAGAPGTLQQVLFARNGEGYRLSKHEVEKDPVESLALWRRYTRDEAARAMGFEFRGMESQAGVFVRPGAIVLFVTLEKATLPDAHKYEDKFLSISEFQWQSQNRTTRESALGRDLREHKARGIEVRLFVRAKQKIAGKTQPFVYCGVLDFKDWDGDKPITVWWHLRSSVPGDLKSEFKIAG